MLPVALLSEPSEPFLIRERNHEFITKLKAEMMENPVNDA